MRSRAQEANAALFAYVEEPRWLAQWVIGDLAKRKAAKRQNLPMDGMWISRQGKNPHLRGSDQAERIYVACQALDCAGMSRKAAMYEIGSWLGRTTLREVEVLRTGVYRFRHPSKAHLLGTWLQNFRFWADWVTTASDETIEFCGRFMRSSSGPRRAKQFLGLAAEMRTKAIGICRKSLYRDAKWYAVAENAYLERALMAEKDLAGGPDQHLVATHYVQLAALYHEQQKVTEAVDAYSKAIGCWQRTGVVDELKRLMTDWIGDQIVRCHSGHVPRPVPIYSGPWWKTDERRHDVRTRSGF
jgi:hypothetical protein